MSDSLNEFGVARGTMAMPNHICDSTPCFGLLHGCMPRNITPSDMDGVTEMNGSFWTIEFKKTGKQVPYGQMLMFERLVKEKGFTVTIIWHDGLTRENKITKMQYLTGGIVREKTFSTYEEGRLAYQQFARWWSSQQEKAA